MCISLAFIAQLLIWIVIVSAVVAIIRVLVPWVAAHLGGGDWSIIVSVLNIVLWAVVAIFIINIVVALIGCLLGYGHVGFGFPPYR